MILNVRDERRFTTHWEMQVPGLPELLEGIQQRLCGNATQRARFSEAAKVVVPSQADAPDKLVLNFVANAFPVHWVLRQLKPLVMGQCSSANEITLSGDLVDAWLEGPEVRIEPGTIQYSYLNTGR